MITIDNKKKFQENANVLVTIDVTPTTTKARSIHECSNVVDVALFTDPEEIYLVIWFFCSTGGIYATDVPDWKSDFFRVRPR